MENIIIQNPAFTLLSFIPKNHLEDTGDDMVYWDITLQTTPLSPGEGSGVRLSFDVEMEFLWWYAAAEMPETATYFDHVRRNIAGFGPKQTRMLQMMQDEGFDFEPLIFGFIKNRLDIQKEYDRQQSIQQMKASPHEAAKMEEAFKTLSAFFEDGAGSKAKYYEFADGLLETANNEAVRIYPEILNAKPEHIEKLGDILSRHIRNLADEVSNLGYEARKG